MPNITEYKPEEKIVALFVSRSKHGKSTAAASFPRPYHQFDFDNRFDGVTGACKPPIGTGFLDPEGISYTRLFTRNGYEPFQDEINLLETKIASGRFPFKSIEIASITSMMQALINSSHKLQKGLSIGRLRLSGPGDYRFEVNGMKQVIDYMHFLPCHVIMSAHLIPKWGKPKTGNNEADQYAANEIVRERLAMRDEPGEVILSCFSNVFKFERELDRNNEMQYYVEFNSDIAGNAFGIPPGQFNITNKPFYPFLQGLIKSIKDGTFVKPKTENNLNMFGENKGE